MKNHIDILKKKRILNNSLIYFFCDIIDLLKGGLLMAKYFGTDGIRGRFGVELSASLAFKVGQSLKKSLGISRLVIGIDTRESSTELMYGVASGAQSVGVNVMLAGVVSTPLISAYSKEKGIAGVMITASHNPYQDNGIKVFHKGNKLTQIEELAIETFVDGNREFTVDKVGTIFQSDEVYDLYMDIIDQLELDMMDFVVGIDSANGANHLIAKAVFEQVCPNYVQIGNEPDGKNINLNVGSTHLEAITNLVKEQSLDLGISFDGDGDRVLFVDNNLNVIDGDLIIYIIAGYLKQKGLLKKDTVVLTSMSNLGIIKALNRQSIQVVLTDVGDKYVLEAMNENDYSLGGENSGHIILKDYINTGDGLLVSLFVLKILYETNLSFSELLQDVTMYPQQMVNIRTYNKDILQDQRVLDVIQETKDVFLDDGKVLVRASGTEPLIRVTLSCEKQEDLDFYMNKIVSVIETIKGEVE